MYLPIDRRSLARSVIGGGAAAAASDGQTEETPTEFFSLSLVSLAGPQPSIHTGVVIEDKARKMTACIHQTFFITWHQTLF